MPIEVWMIVVAVVAVLGGAAMLPWRRWKERHEAEQRQRARSGFRRQRERLEAVFFDKAANSGKPRGLRWTRCDFSDAVVFATRKSGGGLTAFVAVSVSFEAIEGGPMEDVEAVGNLRAATGVFYQQGNEWHTDGRVVFNLSPTEAVEHYSQELTLVHE